MTDAALRCRVGGVPVDVVRYPYTLLDPPGDGPDHFPTASLLDLATMKLSAASRRGIRRDFWDLYVMFESGKPTLDQALDAYCRRYGVGESDIYHVLRALTYLADAEADELFPLGLTPSGWATIKDRLVEQARAALRARLGTQ